MKTFYIAFSAQVNGKNYAGTLTKTEQENIAFLSAQIPNLTAAHICDSRKKAEEMAEFWNDCFKKNGTSAFTV